MSRHLGDYATSTVIYGKFTTFRPSTGAAFTLGGTPALSVYKDNSTTQSTTGVTLTVDFDAVTGLHHYAIDTSADGTFYSAGSNFDVVITTGTVDSVSVVGTVVGSFSLAKTAALRPTTAGRTLDVASTGEAGVDLSNVNVPAGPIPFLGIVDNGTAQSATATTLVARAAAPDDSVQVGMTLMAYGSTQGYWQSVLIDSVSADTYTIAAWPLATPSGTITYYVQGTPSGSPNLLPDVNVAQISGDATAANNCESFFDGTGYAGTGNTIPTVIMVSGLAADTITASALATSAVDEIVDAVWDEVLTGATHNIANSAGRRLRQVDASFVIHTGTAQAGGASSITLAAGASATNDIYKNDGVIIVGGTGVGESAIITAYNGTTKVATVSPSFVITPDNTSEYEIVPAMTSTQSMGADVITAAATAADFGTEIGTATWASATRTLTALDEDNTTLDLDATIRSAIGLASANLDTQIADLPTVAEFELRTPTAAQLAYIVANAATGLPVTFTTAGGSTTAAVLNTVDGAAPSATNDQYNGRLLVFTDGTLKGVVTDITDYVGGTTTATITAIPTAPTSSHNARLI